MVCSRAIHYLASVPGRWSCVITLPRVTGTLAVATTGSQHRQRQGSSGQASAKAALI